MKSVSRLAAALILCTITLSSCTDDEPTQVETTPASLSNTLVLRTSKVKGTAPFSFGGGIFSFEDTSGLFDRPVRYPTGISDLQGLTWSMGLADSPGYIKVLSGKVNGEDVLIVDQNNNYDFTDDQVRQLTFYEDAIEPILVYFPNAEDGRTYRDSTHISVVKTRYMPGSVVYARNEHLEVEVAGAEGTYRLGIHDPRHASSTQYTPESQLALLGTDGVDRDSLPQRDIASVGEYLQLDGQHYRFDSISHQGEYITLVCEPDFAAQIGTQVGMLAPPFELVTISEDTLRSAELLDRPIVLANSCGCGGDKASGDAVAAIRDAYGSEIHALRLDSGYETTPDGYNVNVEHPFNQDVYQQYRKQFCSRIAYLVGRDNRILDKFTVTDWEGPLARHLQP